MVLLLRPYRPLSRGSWGWSADARCASIRGDVDPKRARLDDICVGLPATVSASESWFAGWSSDARCASIRGDVDLSVSLDGAVFATVSASEPWFAGWSADAGCALILLDVDLKRVSLDGVVAATVSASEPWFVGLVCGCEVRFDSWGC